MVQPIVSHLSRSSSDYSTHEKSQTAICNGVAVVKRHGVLAYLRYWIHLAAILVTGGLAALNFLNVYLTDSNSSEANTKLNLFQFAAKAHESLVIGSMMLVLLDYVRDQLITAKGVPLGYMLSPVLFNDLDWVLSREFWSCAVRPSRSNLPLTLVILIAILFANLAGPLSAVLVVPRLGWSAPVAAAAFPTFWNASASRIWPERITAREMLPSCATGASETTTGCPGEALKVMQVETDSSLHGGAWSCLNKETQMSCNVTIDETHTWSLEYDFYSLSPVVSSPKVLIFSTLSSRVTSGIAEPLNISGTRRIVADRPDVLNIDFQADRHLLKPLVRTTCHELDYSSIFQLYQDNALDYNFSTPAAFWLRDVDSSAKPSFVFSWMKNDSSLADAQSCVGQECFQSIACSIDARWIPVSFWYSMQQPDLLYQSDPQPLKLVESGKFLHGTSITIDKDVLELYTLPNSISMSNVFPEILNHNQIPMIRRPEDITVFPETLSSPIELVNYTQAVAVMLGTSVLEFLAEGPFHVGESLYNGNCSDTTIDFTFSEEICKQDPSHWVHTNDIGNLASDFSMASFTLRSNGYGWFFNGIPVKVALGILLFHALLTVLYLASIVLFKRQLTTCWSSAHELLMLAIDSRRAPVLMGHSAGVERGNGHIWQEQVTIREFDSGEELSMVVGDPMHYSGRVGDLPQVGKKYC